VLYVDGKQLAAAVHTGVVSYEIEFIFTGNHLTTEVELNARCKTWQPNTTKGVASATVHGLFSARCNIYISRLCYDVSVRLSVTEVHWRIIANLGFNVV